MIIKFQNVSYNVRNVFIEGSTYARYFRELLQLQQNKTKRNEIKKKKISIVKNAWVGWTLSILVFERVTAIMVAIDACDQGIGREIIQHGSIEAALRATGLKLTQHPRPPASSRCPCVFLRVHARNQPPFINACALRTLRRREKGNRVISNEEYRS